MLTTIYLFSVHTNSFNVAVLNHCRVRVPYPFQWGGPTFDAGDVFGVMTAAFASLIEVSFLLLFMQESSHMLVHIGF